MESRTWAGIVDKVCLYYERKHPSKDTELLWEEKVKGIPESAAPYIREHITDADSFPRNIPAVMWALFNAWQQANPDKKATQTFFSCPDCHEGIIYAAKANESGRKYTSIFRCPKCKQNRVQAYPKAYKDDLIKQGYEIRTPENGTVTKEQKEKCIADMKKLGVQIPDVLKEKAVSYATPF